MLETSISLLPQTPPHARRGHFDSLRNPPLFKMVEAPRPPRATPGFLHGLMQIFRYSFP